MKNKKIILFSILVLGVLLIGSGMWALKSSPKTQISIPEGKTIIYEKLLYLMAGERYQLYIYEDGNVVYMADRGLRIPIPGHPATRTWNTGKLTTQQLDELMKYFNNCGIDRLDHSYTFPGKPAESGPSGGIISSDLEFTIKVDFPNLSKTVITYGYMTLDRRETYPDMPVPLNEIYSRMRVISLATTQIGQENISP